MKRTIAISCCVALLSSQPVAAQSVSGSKAGAFVSAQLGSLSGYSQIVRPSPMLGIFASMYLAQGRWLSAGAALIGIEAQSNIQRGFVEVEQSETFSLLKEFAAILQVEIAEMLNRSTDRREALDTYVGSLENISVLAKRKFTELEALEDQQNDERRAKKDIRDDLQSTIRRALRNEDYETAGANQQKLTVAEREYAEAASKQDQTERIIDTYEELIEVADERIEAINVNRRPLIAGLKVIDVPGIENFEILEE